MRRARRACGLRIGKFWRESPPTARRARGTRGRERRAEDVKAGLRSCGLVALILDGERYGRGSCTFNSVYFSSAARVRTDGFDYRTVLLYAVSKPGNFARKSSMESTSLSAFIWLAIDLYDLITSNVCFKVDLTSGSFFFSAASTKFIN
jgi:hypothetical protein